MDKVYKVVVSQLSLGELRKILPSDYQHLCVNNAEAGLQHPKTFIVGKLQAAYQKIVSGSAPKKRLTLREVLVDSKEGKQLDVFTYSDYANAIDDFLKIPQNDQNLWVVFSSVRLITYQGYEQDGWCSFSLRVGQKPCEAQMWLVTQARPIALPVASLSKVRLNELSEPVSSSEIVAVARKQNKTINECIPSKKANVYAVVNQIVKSPQVTHKGTHHMLLALVDPSCLVPGAQREDLLLHIFLNDTAKPHLPGGVERGDILLLREMTIERFADKVHGKIYSNRQVVKFSSDSTTPIKPVTEKSDYILTDTDRKEVIVLRQWWEKVSLQLQVSQEPSLPGSSHGTEHGDLCLSERTISEIDQEMTCTLYCQVLETRRVQLEGQKLHVFRVLDGTRTAVNFTQYDLHDATLHILTQTESCTPLGSLLVDIVLASPGQDVLSIADGSFVCLKNVQCAENNMHQLGDFPNPMFDLSVKITTGNVIKLLHSHGEAQKILRRTSSSTKEIKRGNESVVGHSREHTAANHAVSLSRPSQPKPSPNRIESQPISLQRMSYSRNIASPSLRQHITIPRSCPIGEHIPQQRSITSSPRIPSHSDSMDFLMREFQSPLEVARNICSPDKLQNPVSNIHGHYSSGRNQTNRNADASNKIASLSDLPVNRKHSTQDLDNKDGETVSGRATSMHSENTVEYGGKSENVSISSPSASQLHQDMNYPNKSIHSEQSNKSMKRKLATTSDELDFVGALGTTSPQIRTVVDRGFIDSTLKKVFDDCNTKVVYRVSALVKEIYFLSSSPCKKCTNGLSLLDQSSVSSHHVEEEKTRIASVSGKLIPVIRLKLCVSDPECGFETVVHLSGDHARKFFGLEPKFAWMVDEVEESLASLIKSFLCFQNSLHFGLQKIETSLGNAQCHICNTTLKLIDE
ncbi:uncharacterized protein [Panulirus ornatus]|uniref:uncharacterized protein isoform X2 n=1 Tax=Panulirus ornatus TaxID=150431 RepID=UPI003A87178D